MPTYIAMLRGINVSGQKKVKMDELRSTLTTTGLNNVRTYIQSGNVIFEHEESDQNILAGLIHKKILEHWSFEVPVLVKNLKELKHVAQNNPYLPDKSVEIEKLHVTFLSDLPEATLAERILKENFGEDDFKIIGENIYLHCPNGYGRTKLNNNFFERRLKLKATTRNWKTVNKLVEMAS